MQQTFELDADFSVYNRENSEECRCAILRATIAVRVEAIPDILFLDAYQPFFGNDLELVINGWSRLKDNLNNWYAPFARLFLLHQNSISPSKVGAFTLDKLEGFTVGTIDEHKEDDDEMHILLPMEYLVPNDLLMVKYQRIIRSQHHRLIH
jgi:hypothetical protein